MSAGGFGFGWAIFPEPPELKLAKIRASIAAKATWPPALDTEYVWPRRQGACELVWVITKGQQELWCPPEPEPEQAPVPTS